MELQAMGLSHCMGTGSRLDFPSEADPPRLAGGCGAFLPYSKPRHQAGSGVSKLWLVCQGRLKCALNNQMLEARSSPLVVQRSNQAKPAALTRLRSLRLQPKARPAPIRGKGAGTSSWV